MKSCVYILFILFVKIVFSENYIKVEYKKDQPILGRKNYLILSDVPIPSYNNTVGYFSTVDIQGKNLRIEKDLEKIVIKKEGVTLVEKEVEWDSYFFEIQNISLDGISLNLKWNKLNRQRMELAIAEWDLDAQNQKIAIEYHYQQKIDKIILDIIMPEFNPNIYLNFDYNLPIVKKQEYNRKYIVLKKLGLNEYDLEITKNRLNKNGLTLKLNSEQLLEGENYSENVKLVLLKEIYSNIFEEVSETENMLIDEKEVYLAVELPESVNYNQNYQIKGNILDVVYGEEYKSVINKIVIADGFKRVEKEIGLGKMNSINDEINLNSLNKNKGQYVIKESGDIYGRYSNLRIVIDQREILVDERGNSKKEEFDFGSFVVKDGDVILELKKNSVEYLVVSDKDEKIEHVNIKFYKEN